MSRMFYGAAAMNSDIRRWDTDNVTNMASMFAYAISFNQDISHWLVDAVVNMEGMFRNASSFDQDLGCWHVGANDAANINSMFRDSGLSASNLNHWIVSDDTDAFNGTPLLKAACRERPVVQSSHAPATTTTPALTRATFTTRQDAVGRWGAAAMCRT